MKKTLLAMACAAAALLCGACTSVATFDYTAAPGAMMRFREAGSATKSVAVMPFMDHRGSGTVRPAGDHGSLYLGLIPLLPYGWVEKGEPENSVDFVSLGRFGFNPQNDLAAAAIASLKTSGLFSSVTKANNQQQAANADYIWRGTVTSTFYRGRMFSYCISYFFSPVLWVVGFPSGSSTNELGVKFELVERATGDVVWQYDWLDSDYLNHWIYARIGKDVSIYPELMKRAMNSALNDLSQNVPRL